MDIASKTKKPPFKITTSHVNPSDSLDAVGDGLEPVNSNDHSIPRFTCGTIVELKNGFNLILKSLVGYQVCQSIGLMTLALANAESRNRGSCFIRRQ
jgi:hypothetical protein